MNPLLMLSGLVVWISMCNPGLAFLRGEEENLPHPFHLTLDPNRITLGVTTHLALRCESNPAATLKPILKRVSKIRILKKTSQDEWQLVVDQATSGGPKLSNDKISASGRVIPVAVDATFLELRWSLVDEDTLGVYRCDVVGTDEKNNPGVEMTTEVELKQSEISNQDLISLLLKTKRDIENQIGKNAEEIEALRIQSETSVRDLSSDKALFTKEFLLRSKTIAWPQGQYALLQPNTGCPVDLAFFGGNSGFVRLHTESTDGENRNKVHDQTHLSQPVITRSGPNVFLYLRFCVVTRVFGDTPWPKGSYCIHAKDKQCPGGFEHGIISLDTEDHKNADIYGGNVPFTMPSDLLFCCKSDATQEDPITLPTDSPFYLYRRGGQCQQVRDMDVVEEFVEIDTEDFVNQNSVLGFIPDIQQSQDKVVRIELCYYS